jgi:hypothetical protein
MIDSKLKHSSVSQTHTLSELQSQAKTCTQGIMELVVLKCWHNVRRRQ